MAGTGEKPFFEHDILYMKQAYDLACKTGVQGEIPVGAVVVSSSGQVLGTGYNQTEQLQSQYGHAEFFALKAATEKMGDWRLEGATLYVTLQPCMMCSGFAALSRIERIVWGADSPVYGFQIDRLRESEVYTKHTKFFSPGVMQNEIESLLRDFFKTVRKRGPKGE